MNDAAGRLRLTVCSKLLLAFLGMSAIVAGLGAFAVHSVRGTGQLVIETFDNTLMSIAYARAARAGFAGMETALARGLLAGDVVPRPVRERQIAQLGETLAGDLDIVAERLTSDRARSLLSDVRAAVAAWEAAGGHYLPFQDAPDWDMLDFVAADAAGAFDRLIEQIAADGFRHRSRAIATVAATEELNLIGLAAALLLAAAITALLARRIVGPLVAASAAAAGIAAGRLDTPIPRAGADELGGLLDAMATMRDRIREMVEGERAGRRSAQLRLVDALEGIEEGIVLAGADGRIVLVNSCMAAFFPALAVGGQLPVELTAAGRVEQRDADGRWLRISGSRTREGGAVAICGDISPLKHREAELAHANRRFDAALSNMSQGLVLFDAAGRLSVVNRRFYEMFRLAPGSAEPGITFRELVGLTAAAGNHDDRGLDHVYADSSAHIARGQAGSRVLLLSDGRTIAVSHQPLDDGGWVATYEDVTERRAAEARISFLARHDVLTALPNRAALREQIEAALPDAGAVTLASAERFAVLCVDLDRFKAVNDTLGHPVGDALLRAVAGRLLACVREGDTVARLGGDEFVVVQRDVDGPEPAARLAARIVAMLGAPFEIEGHVIEIGASVGIALAPDDGAGCDDLLRNADTALNRAKLDGRGTCRSFESGMDARLQTRRALERDLRGALVNGEFHLVYQPLTSLRADRVTGCEALLRWNHPTRGPVSPGEFVPLAEEIGLIVPIGEWVLQQACAEAASWPDPIKIAVNVSAAQFRSPRLVEAVVAALIASGLPASRLELEITESVLLNDSAATLATLHRLRDLGCSIAMDDFGTGYSSLSYLRSFPFDKIKIDQSFVRDLDACAEAAVIVRAITALGASLGMRTTAEGVETVGQLARLRAEGCDEAQGYLLSRPQSAADLRRLLGFGVTLPRAA